MPPRNSKNKENIKVFVCTVRKSYGIYYCCISRRVLFAMAPRNSKNKENIKEFECTVRKSYLLL